jgi:hypothetical protein
MRIQHTDMARIFMTFLFSLITSKQHIVAQRTSPNYRANVDEKTSLERFYSHAKEKEEK